MPLLGIRQHMPEPLYLCDLPDDRENLDEV